MQPVFAAEATHVSVRRYLAHLIDGVLVVLVFAVAVVPGLAIESAGGTLGDVVGVGLFALAIIWLLVGHLAWFVWQERRDGTTLGKRVVGLRVVTADGAIPSTGALWRRSVPLLLEYVELLALAGCSARATASASATVGLGPTSSTRAASS